MVDRPTRPTTTADFSRVIFSDFTNNFGVHPVNGNISRVTNAESIKQALRNLILTNTAERVYNPLIGADIYKTLFETIISDTDTYVIRDRIIQNIRAYEPRVELIDVEILVEGDVGTKTNSVTGLPLSVGDLRANQRSSENSLIINIIFRIINTQEQLSVNVIVERNR